MEENMIFRQDMEVQTLTGNITEVVSENEIYLNLQNRKKKCTFFPHLQAVHQGPNFWVVLDLAYTPSGVTQCVCVDIVSPDDGVTRIGPVEPTWVDNLVYVGREYLYVEFIDEERLVDHWIYGPHHAWTVPENGDILRMWQPFNGFQVYPTSVGMFRFALLSC